MRDAVRNESANPADVENSDGLDRVSLRGGTGPGSRTGRGDGSERRRGRPAGRRHRAAEGLAREQQQLKAEAATLAQAADAASARASSQDSASGPLRSDVRLLQQQLAAQNESLATLSRAVERLRRKLSTDSAPKVTNPKRTESSGVTLGVRRTARRGYYLRRLGRGCS